MALDWRLSPIKDKPCESFSLDAECFVDFLFPRLLSLVLLTVSRYSVRLITVLYVGLMVSIGVHRSA